MKRIYFLVSFAIWYVWLSLVPAVGSSEPNKSLKDIIIGKVSYGLMIYYIYTYGVILEVVENVRGP